MTFAKQQQYANVTPPLTTSSDFSPTSSVSSTPWSNDPKEQKRGRGWPHKECVGVTYSDFPVIGSVEEQEHWFKAKTTERWQYAKLSGPDGEEYRAAEMARSLEYYNKRGGKAQSQSNTDTCLEGVTYFDEPVDRKKHAQEQSRQR